MTIVGSYGGPHFPKQLHLKVYHEARNPEPEPETEPVLERTGT